MANGQIDLYLDVWFPTTHESYWEELGDDLDVIGRWYEPAVNNLSVPEYMGDVNSLSDLAESSTAAMLTGLRRAVDSEDPIVVPLWQPHWVYAALPMKPFEDPEGAFGEPDTIGIVATQGLAEDQPDVVRCMGNSFLPPTSWANCSCSRITETATSRRPPRRGSPRTRNWPTRGSSEARRGMPRKRGAERDRAAALSPSVLPPARRVRPRSGGGAWP